MRLGLLLTVYLFGLSNSLYIPTNVASLSPQVPSSVSLWSNAWQSFWSLAKITTEDPAEDEFDSWVALQPNRSFEFILENIGGISTTLDPKEVSYGVVVASPSKVHPNYFYQWTRDSALTFRSLIYWLEDHEFPDSEISTVIESYIEHNYHLQRLTNKSGKFSDPTKKSLGEPKFHPNGKPFDENWGRPQSDGPGLRVSTIFNYLRLLQKHDKQISNKFLKNEEFIYFNIIKNDLIYIIHNWELTSFDLWEEINSLHFFNSLTQLRALKDGLILAEKHEPQNSPFINDLKVTYDNLKSFILNTSGYVRSSLPYIVETPSLLEQGKRSGLDSATLLASLHAHNIDNGIDYDDIPFDVDNSYIINTISSLVADMKYRYPINHDKIRFRQNIGVGIGRYPEDVYDGYATSEGNPWFISTASASEVIYKLVFKLVKNNEDFVINSLNKDFFRVFLDDLQDNDSNGNEDEVFEDITIPFGSPAFNNLMWRMFRYADSYLEVIKDHVDKRDGNISEQFNKYHGFMQGAKDLTWSYSSLYNAVRWRFKSLELLQKN